MVVDPDEPSLGRIAAELNTRYGDHYTVLTEHTGRGAVRRLEELADSGGEVALILAEQWLPDITGTELLAQAHALHPSARRGLLIEWGDRSALPEMKQAWSLGRIDYFLGKPVSVPDERFHRGVTEFLDEWWTARGTGFELIRVIGEERSTRCHEIRDILSRLDMPCGFYPAESAEGQAALAQADAAGGPLPVVVLRDGQA